MGLTPPTETEHQKRVVEYVEALGYRKYLVMIPNGTQLPGGPKTRARYMASLKKMGLRTGAYDLFLALPKNGWHGAWFEMKRDRTSPVSDEQHEFGELMHRAGYFVRVCPGFDSFREALSVYLG